MLGRRDIKTLQTEKRLLRASISVQCEDCPPLGERRTVRDSTEGKGGAAASRFPMEFGTKP